MLTLTSNPNFTIPYTPSVRWNWSFDRHPTTQNISTGETI